MTVPSADNENTYTPTYSQQHTSSCDSGPDHPGPCHPNPAVPTGDNPRWDEWTVDEYGDLRSSLGYSLTLAGLAQLWCEAEIVAHDAHARPRPVCPRRRPAHPGTAPSRMASWGATGAREHAVASLL